MEALELWKLSSRHETFLHFQWGSPGRPQAGPRQVPGPRPQEIGKGKPRKERTRQGERTHHRGVPVPALVPIPNHASDARCGYSFVVSSHYRSRGPLQIPSRPC